MAYGFEIKNSSGVTIFDHDSLGWRWHDSFIVGATESDSETYSELPSDAVLIAMAFPNGYTAAVGHHVTVSGRTVSWACITLPAPPFAASHTSSIINVYVR